MNAESAILTSIFKLIYNATGNNLSLYHIEYKYLTIFLSTSQISSLYSIPNIKILHLFECCYPYSRPLSRFFLEIFIHLLRSWLKIILWILLLHPLSIVLRVIITPIVTQRELDYFKPFNSNKMLPLLMEIISSICISNLSTGCYSTDAPLPNISLFGINSCYPPTKSNSYSMWKKEKNHNQRREVGMAHLEKIYYSLPDAKRFNYSLVVPISIPFPLWKRIWSQAISSSRYYILSDSILYHDALFPILSLTIQYAAYSRTLNSTSGSPSIQAIAWEYQYRTEMDRTELRSHSTNSCNGW